MTNPTPPGQVPEALQPDTALLVARNCRETGSDPSCPFFARVQLMDAAYVLERLHAENTTLQQGYDAARLEIEALRMRNVEPAGEYPPLPAAALDDLLDHIYEYGTAAEGVMQRAEALCRAAIDADRAMRAQAAPAAVAVPSDAVAYIDIGAGGYLDLGSDLSDEALMKLPKGRHMLTIVGTYGVDGYVHVAAPTTQPEQVAQGDALDTERLDWLTFNISGKVLRDIGVLWSEYGDARRAIDAARSQAKEGANHE